MDLWIRTQDRERLGKLVYLELKNDDYGFHIIGWRDKYEGSKIATYKTKERALEVLDEIDERIMLLNIFETIGGIDNEKSKRLISVFGEEKLKGLMFPYQMPEE